MPVSQAARRVATGAMVTVVVECVVVVSRTVAEAEKVEVIENVEVVEACGTRVDVLV
jgi:hypothetical protein